MARLAFDLKLASASSYRDFAISTAAARRPPSKIGRLSDGPNDQVPNDSEPLPFVPEWTTHLALQYSYELPNFGGPSWLRGWITPRVDWSYTSGYFFFSPEIEQLQQPGYNVVNFRLAWDFNDDRSRIAFWAKNLTDTEYYNSALAFPRLSGSVTRYYEAPRAFGVEVSQRF